MMSGKGDYIPGTNLKAFNMNADKSGFPPESPIFRRASVVCRLCSAQLSIAELNTHMRTKHADVKLSVNAELPKKVLR